MKTSSTFAFVGSLVTVLVAVACSSNDPGTVINPGGGSGGGLGGGSSSGGSSSGGSSSGGSSSGGSSSGGSSSGGSSSGGSSSGGSSSGGTDGGTTDGGQEGGVSAYGTPCTTASQTTPVAAGTDPACTGTFNVCAADGANTICTKICAYPGGGGPQPSADCTGVGTGNCTPKGFCK